MRERLFPVAVVLLFALGLCLTATVNSAEKDDNRKKWMSLQESMSPGKSKQEREKSQTKRPQDSKQAKPIQPLQSSRVLLQKRVSSLEKELTRLRARMAALEKTAGNLQASADTPGNNALGFTKMADNRYVFSANGAKIEIDRHGTVVIRANRELKLESKTDMTAKAGTAMQLEASTNMTAKSKTAMTLESNAVMNIKSSVLLKLNDGGRPVAGLGDMVLGICPYGGGALADGKIGPKPPASRVLIP